jgi:hypothetical protein
MFSGTIQQHRFKAYRSVVFAMIYLSRVIIFLGAFLPVALTAPTPKREVTQDRYIITLNPGVTSIQSHLNWVSDVHKRSLGRRDTAGVDKTYAINNWQAYAGEFDDATIAEIKANPDVSLFLLKHTKEYI